MDAENPQPFPRTQSKRRKHRDVFVTRLRSLLDDPDITTVSWHPSGKAIMIDKRNIHSQVAQAFPSVFGRNKFTAIRQNLAAHGFKSACKRQNMDDAVWKRYNHVLNSNKFLHIYEHPLFRRDKPEQDNLIKRVASYYKPRKTEPNTPLPSEKKEANTDSDEGVLTLVLEPVSDEDEGPERPRDDTDRKKPTWRYYAANNDDYTMQVSRRDSEHAYTPIAEEVVLVEIPQDEDSPPNEKQMVQLQLQPVKDATSPVLDDVVFTGTDGEAQEWKSNVKPKKLQSATTSIWKPLTSPLGDPSVELTHDEPAESFSSPTENCSPIPVDLSRKPTKGILPPECEVNTSKLHSQTVSIECQGEIEEQMETEPLKNCGVPLPAETTEVSAAEISMDEPTAEEVPSVCAEAVKDVVLESAVVLNAPVVVMSEAPNAAATATSVLAPVPESGQLEHPASTSTPMPETAGSDSSDDNSEEESSLHVATLAAFCQAKVTALYDGISSASDAKKKPAVSKSPRSNMVSILQPSSSINSQIVQNSVYNPKSCCSVLGNRLPAAVVNPKLQNYPVLRRPKMQFNHQPYKAIKFNNKVKVDLSMPLRSTRNADVVSDVSTDKLSRTPMAISTPANVQEGLFVPLTAVADQHTQRPTDFPQNTLHLVNAPVNTSSRSFAGNSQLLVQDNQFSGIPSVPQKVLQAQGVQQYRIPGNYGLVPVTLVSSNSSGTPSSAPAPATATLIITSVASSSIQRETSPIQTATSQANAHSETTTTSAVRNQPTQKLPSIDQIFQPLTETYLVAAAADSETSTSFPAAVTRNRYPRSPQYVSQIATATTTCQPKQSLTLVPPNQSSGTSDSLHGSASTSKTSQQIQAGSYGWNSHPRIRHPYPSQSDFSRWPNPYAWPYYNYPRVPAAYPPFYYTPNPKSTV